MTSRSFFDDNPSVTPSGLVGTGTGPSVQRQQGPLGALKEAFNTRPTFLGGRGEPGTFDGSPGEAFNSLRAGPSDSEREEFFNALKVVSLGGLYGPAAVGASQGNEIPFLSPTAFGSQAPQADLFSGNALQDAIDSITGRQSVQHTPTPRFQGGDSTVERSQGVSAIEKLAAERDRTKFDDNLLKTAYDRAAQAFYVAQDEQLSGLKDEYMDRIGDLQEELAGYKGGLTDINRAYSEYADDADAILSQAAAVEADQLPESQAPENIEASFDQYEGVMQETLKQIDSSGNPALAQAMADEVSYMEGVMVDGVRSGLVSQEELHGLASAEAQALAHMAWKDDAYQGERQRFVLEAQIKKTMSDKQDDIADMRDEMNKALARARAEFGDFAMTPDQLWDAAMTDFFSSRELDDFTKSEMTALWQSIRENNPNAIYDYGAFKGEVNRSINLKNLSSVGALDSFLQIQQIMAESDDESSVRSARLMESMLSSSATKADLIRSMNQPLMKSLLAQYDFDVDSVDWDRIDDSQDVQYESLLDLWGHYDDYSRNYNDYISSQAVTSHQTVNNSGSTGQASNNFQNKDTQPYVYRAQVVAPYFVDQIKAAFPDAGITIGGLGYQRPVGDVGGGKAVNSDHQSAGAIDIYANSEQDRIDIAQWFRNKYGAGVSMVIYEGNDAHEGHHVHASFQVGWQVPDGPNNGFRE